MALQPCRTYPRMPCTARYSQTVGVVCGTRPARPNRLQLSRRALSVIILQRKIVNISNISLYHCSFLYNFYFTGNVAFFKKKKKKKKKSLRKCRSLYKKTLSPQCKLSSRKAFFSMWSQSHSRTTISLECSTADTLTAQHCTWCCSSGSLSCPYRTHITTRDVQSSQ